MEPRNKKNMQPRNKRGKYHGYHKGYWTCGNLWYKENYNNGNLDGYIENYYSCKKIMLLRFHIL